MYADRSDKKTRRVNLSLNDKQFANFSEEAMEMQMQLTPAIVALAEEALYWRNLHAANSQRSAMKLRRANA